MNHYGLSVSPGSSFIQYNPKLDFATTSEFTATDMRSIGYSIINGNTSLVFFNGKQESYRLRDNYFSDKAVADGRLDALNKGSVTQPMSMPDIYDMDDAIRNYLIKVHPPFGPPYGLDMTSIDIMRGRDHGVASYVSFRKFCDSTFSIDERNSFNSLSTGGTMSDTNAQKLSEVNATPQDVDLYVGMLMETPISGSMIGSTGNCIWGREFHNKKFGDRHYFEHEGQPGSFSPKELSSLKQVALAKILCQNGEEYSSQMIQGRVMLLTSRCNPEVEYSSLPDLNLSL
jgi:peroxidase